VTRRLLVTMLKANWCGSWPAYWPMFSNHSRLVEIQGIAAVSR
jgi:hypothetical protein